MTSVDQSPLVLLIDKLLLDPKPVRKLRDTPLLPDTPTLIDKALEGLYVAIDTVSNSDYEQREKDWYHRRDFLLECRTKLTHRDSPAAVSLVNSPIGQASDGGRGAGVDEMLNDIQAESRLAQQRALESSRKHKAFAKSLQRATKIYAQYEQAINNISRTAEQQVSRVGMDSQAAVDQIIAEATDSAEAASKSAAQRINNQTRYVLNLDENTTMISVPDWLDRHNLNG